MKGNWTIPIIDIWDTLSNLRKFGFNLFFCVRACVGVYFTPNFNDVYAPYYPLESILSVQLNCKLP